MPYVPEWLQINPRDFLAAAQGGARIGAELAGQGTEANIASGRNATALQEAQMRENTAMSGQQAEAALAQARLEQAAKQQQAEQLLRQWEVQQQIKRQQDIISGQNERAANAITAENERAANALTERQNYGNAMLDVRREANRIAQQRADAATSKPSPSDFITQSEHTPGVSPHEEYTVQTPGIKGNWFKAYKPPTILTTTNAEDLLALPAGSTISTNKIPGSPAITTTRRVPLLSTQQNQRVVIQDQNGKKFSIPQEQLQDALDQGYSEVQ